MKFDLYKSGFDGLSFGPSDLSIEDVCKQISYFKGWDSLKQLHSNIKKWAKKAAPGDHFSTGFTVVICRGVARNVQDAMCPECGGENLDYGDMDGVEGGNVEQMMTCGDCGYRCMDVFVLAERHELSKAK